MKTDLLWIWEEEDEQLLEPDPLGDLTRPEPEAVDGVADELDAAPEQEEPSRRDRRRQRKERQREQREDERRERREQQVPARRQRVGSWSRGARFWGVVVLALAVGTVAPQLIELSTGGGDDPDPAGAARGQYVVAWEITDHEDQAHLAVLAAGRKPPVALALPAQVTINLPGQNLGTLQEAARSGEGSLEVAVENLLGVAVERMVSSEGAELAAAIDAAGGIDVLDRRLDGDDALDYLAEPGEDAPVDAVYLRWQDVLDGLLSALDERPGAVAALPEPLRPAFAGGSPDLASMPVVDIGAGLLRPDVAALERLVEERFVGSATEGVRLVVLNGVGEPGIGEAVARILVPEGFRLVSSGNARDFNFKVTQIVASSREDLPAAERAQSLIGAGKILLGHQPTGLTDVTIVVGRDFGGS